MEVLRQEVVVLRELSIYFDADYRVNKLSIVSEPSSVDGTGRVVTQEQLDAISKVLYGKIVPALKEGLSRELNTNLLPKATYCTFVFSDHTLVAIGNQVSHTYCYLPTGVLMTEVELFETCKSEKLDALSRRKSFFEWKIEEIIKEYKELEKMTF